MFLKFLKKKKEVPIFPIKIGRVGKIGVISFFKKGVSLIFILINPFQCYLSLSVWCVFCLFTPFLSVLFVFHRKNLVLHHLINRYMTFASE